MKPFLVLDDARIETRGHVLAERLSLMLTGPRVVIVGDASPVLATLFGEAQVTAGRFLIDDVAYDAAAPLLGLAARDAPLPGDMTPLSFVAWGARLGGRSAGDASVLAARTCELAGLASDSRRRIARLGVVARRLTVLAQAAVLSPRVLVVEAPVTGVDLVAGAAILAALSRLIGPRCALVSTPRFEPGTASDALARGADELVLIEGGEVHEQGPPRDLAGQSAGASASA